MCIVLLVPYAGGEHHYGDVRHRDVINAEIEDLFAVRTPRVATTAIWCCNHGNLVL